MKIRIIILCVLVVLSSCKNQQFVQVNEFIRVLPNGDSLFINYEKGDQSCNKNLVYYTTGKNTKSINWTESKNTNVGIIQK